MPCPFPAVLRSLAFFRTAQGFGISLAPSLGSNYFRLLALEVQINKVGSGSSPKSQSPSGSGSATLLPWPFLFENIFFNVLCGVQIPLVHNVNVNTDGSARIDCTDMVSTVVVFKFG